MTLATTIATVTAVADPGAGRLVAGMGLAVAAISSAALVILVADPLEPTVIGAGRVLVTGLVMSVLARGQAAVPWRLAAKDHRVLGRVVAAAALLALHFGLWIASLGLTSVVRSVTLVAAQPLFAGVMGRWLGDRVPWQSYVAAGFAVCGTAVMLADGSGPATSAPNLGDALALAAGAAAAAYLAVGRSLRRRLPLTAYLAAVHLLAAAFLGGAAWLTGVTWFPVGASAADAWALVYLGLVPGVVGHGLLNWAVRFAPVHVVSLAIVLEPIGAAALAIVVLGARVGALEALGATVVLGSVAVGVAVSARSTALRENTQKGDG